MGPVTRGETQAEMQELQHDQFCWHIHTLFDALEPNSLLPLGPPP